MKKVLEIGRGLIRNYFKAQQRDFVFASLLNRKPVKRVKRGSDVSRLGVLKISLATLFWTFSGFERRYTVQYICKHACSPIKTNYA